MIMELFYSHTLNMNKGLPYNKFQVYTPLFLDEYRLTKNGFAGPKGFQGFREMGNNVLNLRCNMKFKGYMLHFFK